MGSLGAMGGMMGGGMGGRMMSGGMGGGMMDKKAAKKAKKAAKYGLPQFKENNDFNQWEHEMELWKIVTELPVAKHGPVTFLSLSEKVKAQCRCIPKEELTADDGLKNDERIQIDRGLTHFVLLVEVT